jgi:hypothetical protein
MRLKELSVELRDSIVSRHRSGEGYKKISAALKVPKNTASFLKCKKFGTFENLHRAGRPAKLSNRGRRALVREVTNNPMECQQDYEMLYLCTKLFYLIEYLKNLQLAFQRSDVVGVTEIAWRNRTKASVFLIILSSGRQHQKPVTTG